MLFSIHIVNNEPMLWFNNQVCNCNIPGLGPFFNICILTQQEKNFLYIEWKNKSLISLSEGGQFDLSATNTALYNIPKPNTYY